MGDQPYADSNGLFLSGQHVQAEALSPYPINTGGASELITNPYVGNINYQLELDHVHGVSNLHENLYNESMPLEPWMNTDMGFASPSSASPLADNFASQASLYNPTVNFPTDYSCVESIANRSAEITVIRCTCSEGSCIVHPVGIGMGYASGPSVLTGNL